MPAEAPVEDFHKAPSGSSTLEYSMYSNLLLEHFQTPRNVGDLPAPAIVVQVENPVCGDILRLSAGFVNGFVTEARYKTRGCTASIAAGSALTEWISGKTIDELRSFTPEVLEDLLGGLPNESKHAARLCADAVRELVARRA